MNLCIPLFPNLILMNSQLLSITSVPLIRLLAFDLGLIMFFSLNNTQLVIDILI